MPGIDTSMYTVPQNDLIGKLGQLQALENAGETNKLLKGQQQQQALNISQQQAERLATQLDLTAQTLAGVYGANNGNPTASHIRRSVSDMFTQNPNAFDKEFPAKVLSDLPSDDEVKLAQQQGAPDPVKQWLIAKAVRTEHGRAALQPFLPNMRMLDVGGQLIPQDVNPVTNRQLLTQGYAKTFTPGEATTPDVIGYGGQGQPITGTHAQATAIRQGGIAAPGALPGGAVPGKDIGITAPAPGTAEANTLSAGESAKMAAQLQDEFKGTRDRSGMLANLEDLSQKFTGGPWAPTIATAKGVANQVTGGTAFKESLAAQEEFRKIATQLAQRQMSAMGGTGSAEHLASAAASNPSEKLSNAGALKIVHMLQGNEDALSATYRAWNEYQKQHGGSASYGDFLDEWNKTFEPRAYQLNRMNKDEAAEMLKNMSKAEREQVAAAFKFAHDRGWYRQGQGYLQTGK